MVILGTQWGDEGKGKLVDAMAGRFDFVARATGGANAGHTIVVENQKYIFHLLPSGLLHAGTTAVIGNGTVVHLPTLAKEINTLKKAGLETKNRVMISQNAHLLLDYHQLIDTELERRRGEGKIGTTCRGIGPCYTDKVSRRGIRMGDIQNKETLKTKIYANAKYLSDLYGIEIDPAFELAQIEPYLADFSDMVTDTSEVLLDAHEEGKRILFEGAQGHGLCLDHGTYPYVTSSNVSIGGFLTGLGVPPRAIDRVIGITKAYASRVGGGPFATELLDDLGEQIRQTGHEFGSTTGRPRRVGWLDAVKVRQCVRLNGVDEINLTKLDVLQGIHPLKIRTGGTDKAPEYQSFDGFDEDITKIRAYENLPQNAKTYIEAIESLLKIPITSIGVGPGRSEMIYRAET